MPDQLVNLDMKHGVEAKNYEEVRISLKCLFVCFHIDDAHGVLEIRSVGFLEAAYNIFTVTYRFSLMLIKCYGSIIWQL